MIMSISSIPLTRVLTNWVLLLGISRKESLARAWTRNVQPIVIIESFEDTLTTPFRHLFLLARERALSNLVMRFAFSAMVMGEIYTSNMAAAKISFYHPFESIRLRL